MTTAPPSAPSRVALTRADIEAAAERLAGHVRVTPVVRAEPGTFAQAAAVWLKLESLQVTGAFKARGVLNKVLSSGIPPAGTTAATGGNHGGAIAYAAQRLGRPADIFVPPQVKVERLRRHGANVHLSGAHLEDALAASRAQAQKTGALFLHPSDDPDVVAGAGTIGIELDAQTGGIDTVLVPVGGGGLAAGLCTYFGSRVRVVGVEPECCASMHTAFAAGGPVNVDAGGVAIDSLGTRRVGDLPFELCRDRLAGVVLVTDEAIVVAMRALWQELRVVAEAGGAAALAALQSAVYRPRPGERVAVVVSGGNRVPVAP